MNAPRNVIQDHARYQQIISSALSLVWLMVDEVTPALARLAYCLHATRANRCFTTAEARRFVSAPIWQKLVRCGLFSVRGCGLGSGQYDPDADDNLYCYYRPGYERYFAAHFLVDDRSQRERADLMRPLLHNPAWQDIILFAFAALPTIEASDLLWRLCIDPNRVPSRYEDVLHRDLQFAHRAAAAGIPLSKQGADRTIDEAVELYFTQGRGFGLHSDSGKALAVWLSSGKDIQARERASKLMIAQLSSSDEKVRRDAADGLRLINSHSNETRHALWDAYHRETGWIKGDLLIALGAVSPGDWRVRQLLVERMLHGNRYNIIQDAATGLLAMGKEDDEALTQLFTTLAEVQKTGEGYTAAFNLNSRMEMDKTEGGNPKLIDELLTWLSTEHRPRYQTLSYVARFGRNRPEVIALLLDLLEDEDQRVGSDAALWLGRVAIGQPKVIRALLHTLQHKTDWRIHHAAAALGRATNHSYVLDTMLHLLQISPHWLVRSSVASALRYIRTDTAQVIEALLETMKNDDDGLSRGAAAHSLSKLGPHSPQIVQALLDSWTSGAIGIESLGLMRRSLPAIDRALVDSLLVEGVGPNREHESTPQALRMRRMGNPGMVVLLLEAMDKGEENTKDIIAGYLRWERQAGDDALVNILIAKLRYEKDKELRVAAAKALSGAGQGSQAAVDVLFETLNEDINKELYEAALFSIIRLVGAREEVVETFYKAIVAGRIYRTREGKLSALLNKLTESPSAALQCGDLLP